MHQSIPAVPIFPPSPGNRGAFAQVVSPGGGAFAILSRPGGWALAYPGATPGQLTHVFSNRPFPSSSLPTLQSESKCEVFVMVISSTLHMNEN